VHKDLRRAAQAGGREVLRVEVIAPSPLLAGGLSNFPAIVKFLSDKALSRENDRVRDQQKLAGQDSAELAKAMLSADRFVREESPLPVDAATRAQPAVRAALGPAGVAHCTCVAETAGRDESDSGHGCDSRQLRSRPTTLNDAVRSAEALVAHYSYTPDASPQR
jgi:hypothetical protein